jgi:hypothetical protein
MKPDHALLEAALVGYQARLVKIQEEIKNIRHMLGAEQAAVAPAPKASRRKISAAGRRRIAAAQKKRWAEYKKRKSAGGKA